MVRRPPSAALFPRPALFRSRVLGRRPRGPVAEGPLPARDRAVGIAALVAEAAGERGAARRERRGRRLVRRGRNCQTPPRPLPWPPRPPPPPHSGCPPLHAPA